MLPIFMSLIITLAMSTLLMSNPISLAMTILIMAMTTAMLTSLLISSWIAFLLFLIYIGGMLVMFAYFVATTPNSPMSMKVPMMMSITTFFTMCVYSYNSQPHSAPIYSSSSFLNTFYSTHTTPTLMILALILLLTMIIVVKLVSLPKGPLRPFM